MFPGSSLMAAISSSAEEDRPGRSGRSVGLGAPRGAMTVTSQSARGASSRSGTPDDAFLGNRISSRACCLNAKSSEERVVYKKAELNRNVDSENNHGGSSRTYVLHRTGCVHKKTISYCVKDASGQVHQEGQIGATRWELETLPQPWTVAMEATIFTGWIYDHLLPHAQQVKVAHPLMLRAIAAAKKKNDRIDAGKIADCLRCDFLPECHMASTAIRDRRRTLRYRHLLVRQMVQMKNRISGLLMETGVSHNKRRLHKVGYFRELLSSNAEVNESIRPLLRVSRDSIVRLQKTDTPWSVPYSGTLCWRSESNASGPFLE